MKSFLQQVYKVEDIRDDYIHRQVKQECEVQLEDEIQIANSEEPAKGLTVYDSSATNVDKVKYLYEKFKHETTTIYSDNPFMIVGENPPQRTNGLQNETNDEFIHIVMPLEQVNLLNPGNELLRRGTGSKWGKLSDSLLGGPNYDDG